MGDVLEVPKLGSILTFSLALVEEKEGAVRVAGIVTTSSDETIGHILHGRL